MIRYAVALSDLNLAWKTQAGSVLLGTALDSEDEPETVTVDGVEASVLAGEEEIVESIASGLLCFDLPLTPPRRARVYAKAKTERKWARLRVPEDVPYREGVVEDTGSPRIDPEFVELAAPMDDPTRAALRDSLVAEGCRDALVVWGEKDILLDGHNRLAICRELGIPFKVTKLSFIDRAAAVEWFVAAQRQRRSLTSHWAMYYLGRQYLASKAVHGTNQHTRSGQSDHSSKASDRLATASGVGEKTVRRAAAFAEAVDALEKAIPHARRAVLNREIRLSRRQIEQALEDGVRRLGELRELTEPEERDYLADVLRSARKLRDALDAYRVRGVHDEDRDRLAQPKLAARELFNELPLLVDAFRADVGFVAEGEGAYVAQGEGLARG
jgi:hypothetical protein